jgi:AcrR family transcriptional regulator
MASRRDPVTKILDGLLFALARYGVQKVSMTDVANEAGISRGTLYRYFGTKEEVLAALGTHVLDDFRAGLKAAVENVPEPLERIRAVLVFMDAFIEERPSLESLAQAEPGFVISFFQTNGAEILNAITEVISPAFYGDPNRRRRKRNLAVVSEMILRINLSYQLAPRDYDNASPDHFAEVIVTFVRSFTEEE